MKPTLSLGFALTHRQWRERKKRKKKRTALAIAICSSCQNLFMYTTTTFCHILIVKHCAAIYVNAF